MVTAKSLQGGLGLAQKLHILLQAPRPAGEARATSYTRGGMSVASVIDNRPCEHGLGPAGLRAAALRGAAAKGAYRLCCRSSTMSDIVCVAAPRICPPGARAKNVKLFLRGPLPKGSSDARAA